MSSSYMKGRQDSMKNPKMNHVRQVCSLTRYTVTGGEEKGLTFIDCHNGKLRFLLNESRALDITQLYFEGENISFISKNGCTNKNVPFAKRFEGGMLYTCGLDCVGEIEGRETHGTLHLTPAVVTRMECDEGGILVEGFMRDSALFGKHLLLKRKIYSDAGSDSVEIEDTLINEGTKEEEYALLYHVNLGYPFLDEGGRIDANAKSVTPRTSWAEENLNGWEIISAPEDNREETCYFLQMNEGCISYTSPAEDKRFTLSYSCDTLNEFIVWKSMASGDYALGLEPTTTKLDEAFRFSILQSGEEKCFRLKMSMEKRK